MSPHSYTPKHLVDRILTSKSALEGERKQVTVLFCDIANSTALAARLGPEPMHTLLSRFFELALGEVHRYEGTINQFLGDGFMALFGAPLAHEDHARRAVLAAVAIRQGLEERGEGLGEGNGATLTIRMGLNTGLVVVGTIGDNLRMDYTAVGDTTNVAYRLQQLARPGSILVSQTTSRLVGEDVRFGAQSRVRVKGKSHAITAREVLAVEPGRSLIALSEARARHPFVGRQRELAMLRDVLAQVASGRGHAVSILGEPGVGKSRLLLEFRRTLVDGRVTYWEGRCLSYGSAIPYLPLLDLLRNSCGITATDTPEAIVTKVRRALEDIEMNPVEDAPYLYRLFGVAEGAELLDGLSSEAIKTRTFETLRQMIVRRARRQPVVIAVEDLHWIDHTSEEFLSTLVESVASTAMLVLGSYRPRAHPPWGPTAHTTEIVLEPLSEAESLTVIQAVLGTNTVPVPLGRMILTKAEGNPFFLEELARSVEEHGEPETALAVPDSVQSVIMARIDRLADEPKRLLRTASILGRHAPLRLLRALWAGPEAPDRHLAELTRLEFLHEQAGGGEPIYVFKHVLTQEVAYGSLLTSQRQSLHAMVGRAFEAIYADRAAEVYDHLAYHYSKSKEFTKAVEYLTRLAERSARAYAHVEALTVIREALRHAERLDGAEQRDRHVLDLTLREAHSLSFLGRSGEIMEVLLRQRQRLERLNDPTVAGPYFVRLGLTQSLVGDHARAVESAQRGSREAGRCGDMVTLGKANYLLALEEHWAGQLRQGIEHGLKAVSLLESSEDRWWLAQAYCVVGFNHMHLGEFDPALRAFAEAHAIGAALGDPRLRVFATWGSGVCYAAIGEWDVGIATCRQALDLSPDPVNRAFGSAWLGWAYLEKGDAGQAIFLLEQGLQQFSRFRFRHLEAWFSGFLAEACLGGGQVTRAQELAGQALAIAREVNFSYGVGVAERALGRIGLTRGSFREAEEHLQNALEAFTAIEGRWEMGRTRLALVRLAEAQKNRRALEEHLSAAWSLFRALELSRYVDRTERLAAQLGVMIPGSVDYDLDR
jgi:class 3 adenylate cyclase/tetratricopeptide (TPR) repeat protein